MHHRALQSCPVASKTPGIYPLSFRMGRLSPVGPESSVPAVWSPLCLAPLTWLMGLAPCPSPNQRVAGTPRDRPPHFLNACGWSLFHAVRFLVLSAHPLRLVSISVLPDCTVSSQEDPPLPPTFCSEASSAVCPVPWLTRPVFPKGLEFSQNFLPLHDKGPLSSRFRWWVLIPAESSSERPLHAHTCQPSLCRNPGSSQ